MSDSLRYGPLPAGTIHVCVDMQNLFAPGAPWAAPWLPRVLPRVEALVAAQPAATVFTRFITARRVEDAPGTWAEVYRRHPEVTREALDPRLLGLVPSLARHAPPAVVLDKQRYSAFHGSGLAELLRERAAAALVFSGTETDVCVLASVLDAVDLGYRTVVASDALCSVDDAAHDAAMTLYRRRFGAQVELADTAQILLAWARG